VPSLETVIRSSLGLLPVLRSSSCGRPIVSARSVMVVTVNRRK
jgi:hypothetical protein